VLGADGSETLRRTIFAAGFLGAPVVVIHPTPFEIAPAERDVRLTSCLNLCRAGERVAVAAGVRIALENLMPGPTTRVLEAALDELDPGVFGFCFDSAHDQIDGPQAARPAESPRPAPDRTPPL